jgi:hypothetical protein
MKLYKYNKNTLQYNEVTYKTYIYSIFIILFIGFSIGLSPRVIHTIEKIPFRIQEEEKEFSPERLKGLIREMNFKYSDIVYAQAVLESGNFQSALFKNNKNLFGMRVAQSRTTTHHGSQMGYAYYSNWESSLIDRALWEEAFCRNLNREQYLDLLNKVYAEDPLYKEKLLKIIKDYNL